MHFKVLLFKVLFYPAKEKQGAEMGKIYRHLNKPFWQSFRKNES
jgi:hypothetical protein